MCHDDLQKLLNGEFPELFEDEEILEVSIFQCPLWSMQGAIIGTTWLGSVAVVTAVLSLIERSSKYIF